MQAVCVARVGDEDLAIALRCLFQSAGPVLFERILEQDVMCGRRILRHGSRFVKE
jgi:hypothetical protein